MVKRKICRAGVLEGYWKGEYIAVIPKYHPNENPNDYVVEELDFPSNMKVPRLIEVESTPLSEIKEICEYNDLPFSWITGIDPNDEEAIRVVGSDPLKKAIEHLIAFGSAGTTSSQYRKIFQELKLYGLLELDNTVDFYLSRRGVIANSVLQFSHGTRKHHEKIHDVLQSLDKFIASPSSVRQQNKHRDKHRIKFRQAPSQEEMEQFFLALHQVNPVHELVARILWHLNFVAHYRISA